MKFEDSKGAKLAVQLVQNNYTDKDKQDNRNQAVNELYKEAFFVDEPESPRYIGAKKMHQAVWKTVNRTKPLDYTMHAVPLDADPGGAIPLTRNQAVEMLTTEGFATVLKRGNYYSSFRDKNGMIFNTVLYGDGFRMIGKRGEKGFPVEFIPITNNNLYVSTQSTGFRRGNKPVTEAFAVFSGTRDEFLELFPSMKRNKDKVHGKIPREYNQLKDLDETYTQILGTLNQDDDEVEWGYYFNPVKRVYTLVVGASMYVVEEKKGDDYPYIFKDAEGREEPYIPISHYLCMPSSEGFYNNGIGSLIYDLTIADRKLVNQIIGTVSENSYPLTFVNVPEGMKDSFGQMVEMGYQMRAAGQRAIIPLIYGEDGPNPPTPAQPLQNTGDVNGAQYLRDLYDLEMKRCGVHLDELESADATATQVLADEENANAFVKQMMEYSASEVEFELLVAIHLIKSNVKKSDKTPLNIRADVLTENSKGELVQVPAKGFTLGQLKDELTKYHYFFDINARSGAVPTNTMRRAQIMQTLESLTPEDPARAQVARELFSLNGVELPQIEAPTAQVNEMKEIPTETDRETINPRLEQQLPAIA